MWRLEDILDVLKVADVCIKRQPELQGRKLIEGLKGIIEA